MATPAPQQIWYPFQPSSTYTKLGNRLLDPLFATDHPPAPTELRDALHLIDRTVDQTVDHARLKAAA